MTPNNVPQVVVKNSAFALAMCTTWALHCCVKIGGIPDFYLLAHESLHSKQWCWLGGVHAPLPIRALGYPFFFLAYVTIGNLGRLGGGMNFFERGPTAFGLDLYARRNSQDADVLAWKAYHATLYPATT